jgi:hypothetical protein
LGNLPASQGKNKSASACCLDNMEKKLPISYINKRNTEQRVK